MNKGLKQEQENKGQLFRNTTRRTAGCSSWMLLGWLIFVVLASLFNFGLLGGSGEREVIPYSVFREQVNSGNVAQVMVQGPEIQGSLKESTEIQAGEETVQYTEFLTYLPSFGDDQLMERLEAENVVVETRPESSFPWLSILISLLPFLVLLGIGYWYFRRMQSQGQNLFSFGKSQAKIYDRRQEQTTFEDVAGVSGAKTELQEIIDFLREPEKFERLGGEMPKGVLLVGPPGTGKTLLARAVAGEANAPFFNITGSNFMEMFVGVGASRVRDLFEEAKKAAPAIIFIDELDSIGRRRGAGLGGGHDEREQTLNQLLSEMDGFEPNIEVVVMAATNRPDILDPALLRPGRFDRRITVNMPTMQDRLAILNIHAREKPLSDDVDLEKIARGTPGFSGADLENLLNEAALMAARQDKHLIELADVEMARDKILLGLKRQNLALTDEECKTLAFHEAGHAVVAAVLPHADPIHKVTIVPRGRAMGVTQQLPERDQYLYTQPYLLDRLAVMMGGRAAEALVLEQVTSGAENDLKQATELARKMVLEWGMSERFHHVALGGRREQVFLGEEIAQRRDYSEMTAHEVDQEIQRILEGAFERAGRILEEHRDSLDRLAMELLAEEEIPGDRVLDLINHQ